jgi:serine phosphatase RsbU (regulator of sigma subunit)
VLRATIRARLDLAAEPGRLLSEINRQLIPDLAKLDMFITAQLAFFCHETNQLIYASAGHCPILMYPGGATEAALKSAGGIPLGVLSDAIYESTCESVNSGDRFVFLTDGLYEVHSPEGEILGLDRISEKIPSLWQSSLPNLCRGLLDFVRGHSGGVPAADDRTVLAIEWL